MKNFLVAALVFATGLYAQSVEKRLPDPVKNGGMPVMEAIAARKTSRNFKADAKLTDQQLSTILWSANGFNRPNMRTAPSALNAQAVEIFAVTADGIWFYRPADNTLTKIKDGDHRAATGKQSFVANAALNLVFVYDLTKAPRGDARWAVADSAFAAENVYLVCASEKLGCVIRGGFPQELAQLLQLPKTKTITLCQSVGPTE